MAFFTEYFKGKSKISKLAIVSFEKFFWETFLKISIFHFIDGSLEKSVVMPLIEAKKLMLFEHELRNFCEILQRNHDLITHLSGLLSNKFQHF